VGLLPLWYDTATGIVNYLSRRKKGGKSSSGVQCSRTFPVVILSVSSKKSVSSFILFLFSLRVARPVLCHSLVLPVVPVPYWGHSLPLCSNLGTFWSVLQVLVICGHLVSNTTSIDTNLKLVKVSVHLTLSIDSGQKTLRTYEYSIVVQSCRN